MIRRLSAALVAAFFCIAPLSVRAQSSPNGSNVVSKAFSISSATASPILSLTAGQSTCYVTIESSTSFSGATIVPQVASDGPNVPTTWSAVTSGTLATITAAGVYGGSITATGITNFRVSVSALSSGTVTGVESCSTAAGAGGSHVTIDNPAVSVFTPVTTGVGANPGQAVIGYNYGYNASATRFDSFTLDSLDNLNVNVQAGAAKNSSGAAIPVACDNSAVVNITSATTTQLVPLSAGKSIYVCAYAFSVAGTTTPNATLEFGTGTACATGTTALTGAYATGAYSFGDGTGIVLKAVTASNALCILSAGTSPSIQGVITYSQF